MPPRPQRHWLKYSIVFHCPSCTNLVPETINPSDYMIFMTSMALSEDWFNVDALLSQNPSETQIWVSYSNLTLTSRESWLGSGQSSQYYSLTSVCYKVGPPR